MRHRGARYTPVLAPAHAIFTDRDRRVGCQGNNRKGRDPASGYLSSQPGPTNQPGCNVKVTIMSRETDNKAIVGRWFTDFWG